MSSSSSALNLGTTSVAAEQGRGGSLMLLALIALALTLRSPLTAIPPIIDELRRGLAMGPVAASLLTSIPVLCFGALTPFASLVIARTSIETAIFLTLVGAALGMVIRSAGGIELALAGTVVLGASLTIGNIVSLMVIARDFPRRSRFVTGVYTSALNVGTMLTSALTAPLSQLFGWRIALAAVAALAPPSIALWAIVLRRQAKSAPAPKTPGARPNRALADRAAKPVWRRGAVWLLVAAFGAHLFIYYGMTAWLPAYLMLADGMTATGAGLAASMFQLLALLGSFGVPALASRIAPPRLLVGVAACWMATPLGLLLAPQAWLVWSILGGIATGGGFTVIFILIMIHARDLDDNRKISSLVQGAGYTFSSAGPFLIGGMNQAFGDWRPGFLLLASMAAVMMGAGFGLNSARSRESGARSRNP